MAEDIGNEKPRVETFTSGPIDMGGGYNTLTIRYYPASKMDANLDYQKTSRK